MAWVRVYVEYLKSICGILEAEKVGSRQVWSKGDKSFSYKDLAPHQKP